MTKNILFVIGGCKKCLTAKKHLAAIKLEFEEINILENPTYAKKLLQYAGEINIPAFLHGKKVLTGDDIFTVG